MNISLASKRLPQLREQMVDRRHCLVLYVGDQVQQFVARFIRDVGKKNNLCFECADGAESVSVGFACVRDGIGAYHLFVLYFFFVFLCEFDCWCEFSHFPFRFAFFLVQQK